MGQALAWVLAGNNWTGWTALLQLSQNQRTTDDLVYEDGLTGEIDPVFGGIIPSRFGADDNLLENSATIADYNRNGGMSMNKFSMRNPNPVRNGFGKT